MQKTAQSVAVVTGASRGIGAAVAKLLGATGYSVAVNYANDKAAAQCVVDHLNASGSRAMAIQADVSREADVVCLFETV
jgi:3-oxoacyl-[acyl-carrier protein] reductase